MKEVQLISSDYPSRMKEILDESWKIFKWQFSNETFNVKIENEANFQFYFAMIIKNIGEMFTKNNEHFFVDVETKWGDAQNNRNKLIDITCGFNVEDRENNRRKVVYASAIELKFFKGKSAFTSKMFKVYKDLAALDREINADGAAEDVKYSEGHFYLVSDSPAYKETPAYKAKTQEEFPEFGLNKKYIQTYVRYHDDRETKEPQILNFRKAHEIKWDEVERGDGKAHWYFLEIAVTK